MAGRTTPIYDLTGPQRAAVILLSLGAEYGKAIWSALEEDEIRVVTHAMVQLGSVEADTVEDLIVDFVGNLGGRRGDRNLRPHGPAPRPAPSGQAGRSAHGGDQGVGEPQHVAAPGAH
jgi:hypothetical protein